MANNGDHDRSEVKEFFDYEVDTPDRDDVWILWVGGIAAIVVWWVFGFSGGGFVLAVIASLGLMYLIFNRLEESSSEERGKREIEYGRLAIATRSVQATDSVRAFLRIFERSQIPITELRDFEKKYVFEKEKDLFSTDKKLFSEDTLIEKLGDLYNKSIRLYSRADFNNKKIRKVQWKDEHRTETFYNPMRIVALFLTESEMVICDAQIDSIDGDLKEAILRVMLTDIVSIGFTSERVRIPLTKLAAVQMAKDLGIKDDEIELIENEFSDAGDNTANDTSKYVLEDMTSKLEITRTDGGALSFPIRSEIQFGKHVSALDQSTSLTDDELTVDRMVNELNRVVRGSRVSTK